MSKKVKCQICAATEEERCSLMRVEVDKEGKESYYCCERTHKGEEKRDISHRS
ncbi:MAG TPA: hypothetical protein VGB32_14255 [Candidatus Bathyarchaeia archaeon]